MRISSSAVLLAAQAATLATAAAVAGTSRDGASSSSSGSSSSDSGNGDGNIATPLVRRTASGKGITMPLYQRAPIDRTPEQVIAEANRQRQRIRNRYGNKNAKPASSAPPPASDEQQKRGNVALVDVGPDSFYFAQIAVGTPPQLLNCVLDTGSADFWIADSECSSAACRAATTYNEGASSTLIRSNTPWDIQYGKGAAAGLLAADTVSLAGYTVVNSTFALATQVSEVLNQPLSGLMGMGWKSLTTTGATPFWQAVVESGDVQDQVFSFQLARNVDAENLYTDEVPLNQGGVFTLGEIDESQFDGSITWHTVPNQFIQRAGYWALELDSITLQGRTANAQGNYGIIDTGTTLIAGPANLISAFYELIPNSQPISDGFYVFPCTTQVELSFTFDGTTYPVNPQDFNFGPVGQGYCMGSLFEESLGEGAPQFILGGTFLKNVYSAYRYNPPSVGFAALKNNQAQLLPVPSGVTAPANNNGGASPTSRSSSAAAPPTTVPPIAPTATRGSFSPTGLQGGQGLPNPSVVGGSSGGSDVRPSTQPSSGSGGGGSGIISGGNGNGGGGGGFFGGGGGGSTNAAGSLGAWRARSGALFAGGSALGAALVAGAAVVLL